MKNPVSHIVYRKLPCLAALLFIGATSSFAQLLPPGERGAPEVTVTHADGRWVIAGIKQTVTLNDSTLAMSVEAGRTTWRFAPSEPDDMIVKSQGEEFDLQLTNAGKIQIEPYNTGYQKGVKIRLEQFHNNGLLHQGADLDLALVLTLGLEGKDEDLVCGAVAIEHEAVVRRLDWPKEVDTRGADYTALSNVRGNLLPCNWPKEYNPFLNVPAGQGQEALIKGDTSYIQANLIECWSMSWWGIEKGSAALVVIVETPDDASYKFHHPPGGPTVIGPRWLDSLGRLAYPRSVRFCFIPNGNYVDMAKRYRRYVMDSGQFVSLREKIAQQPLVADLIGTPFERQHALRNYKVGSHRWLPDDPTNNYHLVTFDQLAQRLRAMKAAGIDRAFITLAGWPYQGYDRQHPDAVPPSPAAGGWQGLQRWVATCQDLGYMYNLHDQYRDYYIDAPSWDPQFAVHEEDNVRPASIFPGTRFGGWKEGYIPYMDYWDGGKMGYLDARFALGHLVENYQLMFDHGIHMEGSYLDVFGYIPPTQDFNPEHPLTRADCMRAEAACFHWVRRNLGIVGTEAGSDWVVPYVDYVSDANQGSVIPAPLYELVYHDAVMTPEGGTGNYLRCLLNGGYATVPANLEDTNSLQIMRTICALHTRVALLEMTNHEFLDKNYRKERTTFADGTTVTVDWDAKTFDIEPPLKL